MGSTADPGVGPAVLVGGSGFVGTAVAEHLLDLGRDVVIVDRVPPHPRLAGRVRHRTADLLTDAPDLPDGEVVLLAGNGDPRTRWPWTIPVDVVATTSRLLPHLTGRRVTLVSTVEAFGAAPGPLTESTPGLLPWDDAQLREWARSVPEGEHGVTPWQAEPWARRLLDGDPSGRWTYGMAKRAQELLVGDHLGNGDLVVLRLANTVGRGQERVVSRLARRAAAGRPLTVTAGTRRSFVPVGHVGHVVAHAPPAGTYVVGCPSVSLEDLARSILGIVGSDSAVDLRDAGGPDSCGLVGSTALDPIGLGVDPVDLWLADAVKEILSDAGPVVHPPLGVVVPPRPARPARIAERQQAALWSGAVKNGQRWSAELTRELAEALGLDDRRQVLATTSGTDALRLVCGALAGPAPHGAVAALPSFTFPATAEVLLQLGYRLRFVDVDDRDWTLDPSSLEAALAPGDVRLVVAVDTFGHPCRYGELRRQCHRAGALLVGDSAAAIGSRLDGEPVAAQADGHAYSMSFAKVLSAGGAGGAAVLPAATVVDGPHGWTRSALMNELHAVVALDQLEVLEDLVARRGRVAAMYEDACARLGLGHQDTLDGVRHSWVHFVVRVPGGSAARDAAASELAGLGVGTKPYFLPLHLEGTPGEHAGLAVTERLAQEVLALPMSSELNEEQADLVCVALERVFG